TITTLSTLTSIVAQQASPPFSFIDPHTTGLLALGYAIDSLRLLDIETSDLTVKDLEARIESDLRLQFTALAAEGVILGIPATKDIEIWAKSVVDKLLCKKEHGSSTERMFDTDSKQFYEFQHSLLEEYARGNSIYVRPTATCLTLYLGTPTQGIGDIQTALTAVIQRQIKRGDYHAAFQSSLEHQRITKQHGEKIRAIKRKLQSNAGKYSWNEVILPDILTAQEDAKDAIRSDTLLEELLEERIDELPQAKRPLAHKVLLVIRICRDAYRELQTLAMGLPRFYSACILNQGPAIRTNLPSMMSDIFTPMFYDIPDPDNLLTVCDVIDSVFTLPAPPVLHDIVAEIELLLKPVTAIEARDLSEDDQYIDEEDTALVIFDQETIHRARNKIAEMANARPTRLSEVNAVFDPEGFTEECIVASILISSAWAKNSNFADKYSVTRLPDYFSCDACAGDDYMINLAEEDKDGLHA
ncbi:MAG: hypothetical protein WCL71_16975, partial [Deltaproteobacteria bacterium]